MLPNKLEQNSQTKVRSHEFSPQIVVDSLTVYSKINFTEKKKAATTKKLSSHEKQNMKAGQW